MPPKPSASRDAAPNRAQRARRARSEASAGAGAPRVLFADRAALRRWLARHHATHGPIWLVYRKRDASGTRALSYDDIVEEALSFGWIDSVSGSVDSRHARLYFSPRRPRSVWSARNKRLLLSLEQRGLMTDAGRAVIERAKADGSWSALDEAESLRVPADLARAFDAVPGARANYDAFPPGARKQLLTWVTTAKRPETRAARVSRAAELAGKNIRASAATPAAGARHKPSER